MRTILKGLTTKAKAVILYPVSVFFVTAYSLWIFTKLWIQGYAIEYILQILFVDLQNNVGRLISRSIRLAPLFYFIVLYLIFGSIQAIVTFFTHLISWI